MYTAATNTIACRLTHCMRVIMITTLTLIAGTPIKKVIKPSFVLPVENYLYVSAFWIDQVVRINLEPRSRGQDEPPMITFAQGHGLDGPWGLAVRDGIL